MPLLSADVRRVRLDGHPILHDLAFAMTAGTGVGLIGPNGSGKTTLLRALGAHVPVEGTITLDGRPVEDWSAAERARRLAYVRQAPSLTFDFTVEELVLLGRAPHRGWLQRYRRDDRARVRAALRRVDLDGFADRSVLSLSGGETQRVFLAQALVQEADLLLLDEPTAHLDVHYQFSFMEQVRALVNEGRGVLTVFHDLERAARYAERLLVLDGGRLVADGPPADVLTPGRIAEVFGMEARVETRDGRLCIEYLGPTASSPDTAGPSASTEPSVVTDTSH
jgi:iron complex transport system ATP-binding protein